MTNEIAVRELEWPESYRDEYGSTLTAPSALGSYEISSVGQSVIWTRPGAHYTKAANVDEAKAAAQADYAAVIRSALSPQQDAEQKPGKSAVDFVMQYGGRCRDCADHAGICPNRNLPCEPEDARKAIEHVLAAVDYGVTRGLLAPTSSYDAGVAASISCPECDKAGDEWHAPGCAADTGQQVKYGGSPPASIPSGSSK